jgi:hypothetical protein
MKKRSGFVSNSSSSSFIVMDNDTKNYHPPTHHVGTELTVDTNLGENEFGWEITQYTGYGTKIIFAYLQARYVQESHPEWMEMLERVIKEALGVTKINWDMRGGYIDHQSSAEEGKNIEIFQNEESLKNFLFNTVTYIQGGNDNYESGYDY